MRYLLCGITIKYEVHQTSLLQFESVMFKVVHRLLLIYK